MDFRENRELLRCRGTELRDMAVSLGFRQIQEKLDCFLRAVNDNHFFVTVIGEFNRGKSTMINALLGEDILPTAIRPTTATLNFIHTSSRRFAMLHYKEGGEAEVTWDKKVLRNFTALGKANVEDINYLEIGCPLEALADDIVIVDTPGVNDIAEQRTDVTFQYIPLSDAVVFVLSAIQPMTQSEFI